MATQTIGGGPKKILYTLNTVRRIGLRRSAKALATKNTCKACALGMGGQSGGMTNELGEFPSVCNKSVQAQSTDIQPAIPTEVFNHSIADFGDLSPREMETLGRLANPIYKAKGADKFETIEWEDALSLAASKLKQTDPNRSFFYASGRSSNEAGFLFQLVARLYGTNNVTNCSYYCHQATGIALAETIGSGTSTVELADLRLCDTIFVIGANPSSNHPRFIHQLKKCRDRGGEVIIINPAKEPGLVKFSIPKSPSSLLAGGSDIASDYLQPKIGGDLALFKGIAKAVLNQSGDAKSFIKTYTENWHLFEADIKRTNWPDIEQNSGVHRDDIERVARLYVASKSTVFAWGMGMTHHLNGVENIEMIANLALTRGMIGRPGAGLLPLRGHSNVQGIGTIGVKPVLAEDVMRKMEQTLGITLPEKRGLDTMASMQSAAQGNIDAALIMGGNLLAANPNSKWAEQALNRIGFKLFLTTTLNKGHVTGIDHGETLILPVTARDEEWEATTQESMFNFVRLSDGGIKRLDNVRPESAILANLGARIVTNSPLDFSVFAKHSNLRKAIAEIVPGMAEIADIDVAKREFHISNRLLHEPHFNTTSGRARFKVCDIPDTSRETRAFTLSTLRSEGQFNSIIYEEKDSYRGVTDRWTVLMNPGDMVTLGVEDGDRVSIKSDHGEMRRLTVRAFDVTPGNVLAYYPEANVLTGTTVDPRSRTPAFKYTRVDIHPAANASA